MTTPHQDPAREPTWRPRYGLKTLLLVMLVSGPLLGWIGIPLILRIFREDSSIVHPVVGRVTLNGSPVNGVTILFHSLAKTVDAVGVSDTNGQFQMSSFEEGDGAVAGDYSVVLSRQDANGSELLHAKYSNSATTVLRVSVKAGNNQFDFDVSK